MSRSKNYMQGKVGEEAWLRHLDRANMMADSRIQMTAMMHETIRPTMVDQPCECGETVNGSNWQKHLNHQLAEA